MTCYLYLLTPPSVIDVQGGTFALYNNENTGWENNKADLNVASGATFWVEGTSVGFVDVISGNGTIKGGSTNGTGRLTIGVNNGSGTFSGAITDHTGGNLQITKSGSGIQTLSGTNSYTGTTLVSSGTLLINGNQTLATGTTTVSSGARIGGNGTIGGNLALDSGAQFVLNLSTPLTVLGTVSLDNTFSIASLVNADGSVIDWSGVAENTYTVISNNSSFSNIQNWGYANRAINLGGGREAYFDTGSLDLHVVPEPATWALLAFSLTTVVVLRRRRNI